MMKSVKIVFSLMVVLLLVTLALSGEYKSDVYPEDNLNITSTVASHTSSTADFTESVDWDNFTHTGTDFAICTVYIRKYGAIVSSNDFYYSAGNQTDVIRNVNAFDDVDPSPTCIQHLLSHFSTINDTGFATLSTTWQ